MIKVGIVGAAGETGRAIVDGLLQAGGFTVIALARPASLSKPANIELGKRGLEVRAVDLKGSHGELVASLSGIEVLISAIAPMEQLQQIPLATAAKEAGVKRFVPCAWVPVMPAGNINFLRDVKEQVYNHVKTLRLPYTIIDVGWWYQLAFPRLPSGKVDYAVSIPNARIPGDGQVPSALTDVRDIGRYVAKIIADDRTLNKMVFVYDELWTQHQIYDLMERVSGETLPRDYEGLAELQQTIHKIDTKFAHMTPGSAEGFWAMVPKLGAQYKISWGIRGDNTPEYAKYLGYLDGKELYPDMSYITFEEYIKEVMSGRATAVYAEMKERFGAALRGEPQAMA